MGEVVNMLSAETATFPVASVDRTWKMIRHSRAAVPVSVMACLAVRVLDAIGPLP